MNEILFNVQRYLDDINFGRAECDPKLIEEFGERSKELLSKKLNEKRKDKFTLRMSNVGRPLCQLQAEKQGMERQSPDNFFPMKMMFGDMIETLAIVIMKAAGVEIQNEQILVSNVAGIEGTFDVEIDGKIWDIKSAADWSFNHKFKNSTIQDLWNDDSFGYVGQLMSYAKSVNKPAGGWIVINKQTGEWTVLEAKYDEQFEKEVLDRVAENTRVLNSNEPFKRCYSDYPELFYKRETGNRVLGIPCTMCSFKFSCWPNLQIYPSLSSTAKNKPLVHYTVVQEKDNTE